LTIKFDIQILTFNQLKTISKEFLKDDLNLTSYMWLAALYT